MPISRISPHKLPFMTWWRMVFLTLESQADIIWLCPGWPRRISVSPVFSSNGVFPMDDTDG
jgi:hypothetical protein